MSENELAEWVRRELMADQTDELTRNKEKVKELIHLTPDGGIIVKNRGLTSRSQVALYYIGAAYAKVAGLREQDAVANKEIADKLSLPEGTVHPKVKELRDGHFIETVREGVHKINYGRVGDLLDEARRGWVMDGWRMTLKDCRGSG